MNCNKCPNRELVERARACCLACDPDAIPNKNTLHYQANDYALAAKPNGDDQGGHAKVTHLDQEDEDALREAMASMFGLDPVDLLLVQHLVNGGRMSTFYSSIMSVGSRISSYRGPHSARVHAAWKRVVRKVPQLAPVIGPLLRDSSRSGLADAVRSHPLGKGRKTPRAGSERIRADEHARTVPSVPGSS